MPLKDPEKRREYDRLRSQTEKRKQQKRESIIRNKDSIEIYQRKYMKEYGKTEKGKRVNKTKSWKHMGVKGDLNELYDIWLNASECENCGCILNECFSSRKCLDHCHITGNFRNILCHNCNTIRR